MSSRFEMSFKNKVVRMWLILMVPSVVVQLSLTLFTEVPSIIPAAIPAVPMTLFFVWLFFYNRSEGREIC